MTQGKHHFRDVTHGLLFFRARCGCGWVSRRRWKAVSAEADLMQHQKDERDEREGE